MDDPLSRKTNNRHLLGNGGSGAVYLAQDLTLNSAVAVKQSILLDEKSLLMFRREAEFLANLTHAALPKVGGFFSDAESCFIVMELIRGDDLEERVTQSGPLPFAEVKEIALQLLEVLEYLHSHSIIHKDVKPSNLKYTNEGELKLLDFGFAKGSVGLMSEHKETIIKGVSPAWASPEQLAFEPATPQSDLYSAAATLYFLSTGVAPPDANVRTMSIAINGNDLLESFDAMEADVPEMFAALVTKALSLIPEARPESAAAMKEHLISELAFAELEPILPPTTNLEGSFGYEFREIMRKPLTEKDKALEFAGRGDYWLDLRRAYQALNHYNTAVALDSSCVEAYVGRGSAHLRLRQYEEAIDDFSKAINLQPALLIAYQKRKTAYKAIQEKALAKADRKMVVELRRSLPLLQRYPRKLVVLYAAIGLLVVCAGMAVWFGAAREPTASDYFLQGNNCATDKNNTCAITNYSQAILLNPRFSEAYLKRGISYIEVKDYEKAIRDLDTVLGFRKEDADARFWRGMAYADQKRYDEAIADYTVFIKMRPNDGNGYFNRALAFYFKDSFKEAVGDYTVYISIDPTDHAGYYNRGLAYDQTKQFNDAIRDYTEAIKIQPDYAAAYYCRARDYFAQKQYAKTIEDCSKYIDLRPKDGTGYRCRSRAFARLGDAANAVADLESARKLEERENLK